MLSMLISVVLNAILAPIFIFGFRWGMQGAALATVISQAVSAVWVVAYFLGGASVLRFHVRNLRPRWPRLRPHLRDRLAAVRHATRRQRAAGHFEPPAAHLRRRSGDRGDGHHLLACSC